MKQLLQNYLRFWAKIYLKRVAPEIVSVTGSVGKTSTKEAIFAVLQEKFGSRVRKSEGNLNNETGMPLAILGYRRSPEKFWQWLPIILLAPWRIWCHQQTKILVLEMAADKPGDIRYLVSLASPKVACVTSVGPAHLQAFGTLEKVADEKLSLARALPPDGWAVLNRDDDFLNKARLGQRIKFYGLERKADCLARNITTEIANFQALTKFQIIADGVKFYASVHTLGRRWNVYAALAAASVGLIKGLAPAQIVKGLAKIRTEKHRLFVLRGKNDSVIIDDCYNANPLSMRAALDVLKILPSSGGRKIAVLGDMLELGRTSATSHALIGEYAGQVADEVVAIGHLAKKYQANRYFEEAETAAAYLLAKVRTNDIILIKASRAIGLEKIVEKIRA